MAASDEPAPKGANAPPPEFDASDRSSRSARDRAARVASRMLDDAPVGSLEADLLGFAPYARALAALIEDPNSGKPFVLAINAPWGAGKSSMGRLIEASLIGPDRLGPRRHTVHWFNAWLHDDAESLTAAMTGSIGRASVANIPWWKFVWNRGPVRFQSWKMRAWDATLSVVVVLACVFGAAIWWHDSGLGGSLISHAERTGTLDGVNEVFALLLLILVKLGETMPIISELPQDWRALLAPLGGLSVIALVLLQIVLQHSVAIAKFVRRPKQLATEARLAQVRDQLQVLIQRATRRGGRFVLFVDDIERCRHTAGVDALEAINQLVAVSGSPAVVVILADMPALSAAVEVKYQDIAKRYDPASGRHLDPDEGRSKPGSFGRLYLQKIVQMQFDLPEAQEQQVLRMIEHVTGFRPMTDRGAATGTPAAARRRPGSRTRIRTFVEALYLLRWMRPELEGIIERLNQEMLRREVVARDSPFVIEALKAARRYAPSLPRNAKRTLNKLRLMLLISFERGVLTADPESGSSDSADDDGRSSDGPPDPPAKGVTPRQLGLWVAFQERWPVVFEAFRRDFGWAREAVRTAKGSREIHHGAKGSVEEYRTVIDEISAHDSTDEALRSLLAESVDLIENFEELRSMGIRPGDDPNAPPDPADLPRPEWVSADDAPGLDAPGLDGPAESAAPPA